MIFKLKFKSFNVIFSPINFLSSRIAHNRILTPTILSHYRCYFNGDDDDGSTALIHSHCWARASKVNLLRAHALHKFAPSSSPHPLLSHWNVCRKYIDVRRWRERRAMIQTLNRMLFPVRIQILHKHVTRHKVPLFPRRLHTMLGCFIMCRCVYIGCVLSCYGCSIAPSECTKWAQRPKISI